MFSGNEDYQNKTMPCMVQYYRICQSIILYSMRTTLMPRNYNVNRSIIIVDEENLTLLPWNYNVSANKFFRPSWRRLHGVPCFTFDGYSIPIKSGEPGHFVQKLLVLFSYAFSQETIIIVQTRCAYHWLDSHKRSR